MSDVCAEGLRGSYLGGVFAVDGTRTLIFDADGTRQAVRQRALPEDDTRPALRRRAQATAPGYRGRKRGEAVRARMTVQQRHTGEWLGTFGAPGNGDTHAAMGRVCKAVVQYLTARDLPLRCGVVRLDGEHGWVHHVVQIAGHGLGYVLRCVDYQILRDPRIAEALAAGAIVRLQHADSGIARELFDLPSYPWSSLRAAGLCTRLLIARRRAIPDEKVAIGKLLDGWIYELVVTDRTAAEWDAARTYTLFQERGTFEATLAQEDQELPTDRWVTFAHDGQELWQILCQWVWNLRLRASVQAHGAAPATDPVEPDATAIHGASVVLPPEATERAATATTAASSPSDPTNAPPSVQDTAPSEPLAVSTPASVPTAVPSPTCVVVDFGTGVFARKDAHTVICPAGVTMYPSERVVRRIGECVRYQAPPKKCAECTLSEACRGHDRRERHGRRITLPVWNVLEAPEPPQSKAGRPRAAPRVRAVDTTPLERALWESTWQPTTLWLQSVAGSALRRGLRDTFRGHRVTITSSPSAVVPAAVQRSHRRKTWCEVWSRNALTGGAGTFTLAGISANLAAVLGLPTTTGP